jgi:hypothetical protein
MTWREDLRENRWRRCQLALLTLVVANIVLLLAWPGRPPAWMLSEPPVFAVANGVFWFKSRRLGRVLKAARAATEAKAKELRTPRAPDAGPDECPVCGGFGLDELAADDEFMERGALAKVVAYGSRRAHWDCAEFVPCQPTQAEQRKPDFARLASDHRRNHHGAPSVGVFGCPVCAAEETGKDRDLRRGRALSEMARERERAPRRAPCVFTARIHKIPVEQRWAHARACGDCMAAVVRSPTWIADGAAGAPLPEPVADETGSERRQAANAAWCEEQAARMVEETRRRWK